MSEEKVDKMICPDCKGNGYRRIWKDSSEREKITIQCARCESQGEIPRDFVRFEEHSDDEYAYHLKKFFKGKLN
jgi:DnaJ-class molecular chaperone